MADEEQSGIKDPEISAVAVNLSDIDSDVDEDENPDPGSVEETKKEKGGVLDDLMDDIFAEEPEDDDRLKAFGDLEHLTMVEVSSEVEAVLEELRIRQGGYE